MSNIKVTVQNENNVLLEVTPVPIQTIAISRGVAGRGVSDVQAIEIDNSLYLEFFFTDGTTEIVGPVGTIQYIGQSPIVVNASTISLSTVPVNLGGTGQTTANAGFNALAPSQTGNAGKYLTTDGSNTSWANNPLGTVTSVDMTVPTGLTVSGNPITTSGTLAVALQSGYSIPTTASQANWNTAYSERLEWDGGATNLVPATGRTSLGLGTIATQNANAVSITGGTITGITDLAVADGGTGASTAAGAMVNLLPSYTGNANKRLSLDGTATGLEWVTDGGGTVTSVDVSGGTTGLSFTGGPITTSGTITLSGTLDVDNGGTGATTAAGARTNLNAADQATTISAGTGLSGGGDLSANRTLSIANTAVTAGAYGSASNTLNATVNAQGQLTALAATPIAIANTQVSGLGTMSTQNSNAVTITGGSITGITDLAIADGGTGASNAADARSNLGLGTAAVLNAGVALGVATLDAGGTVPLSQIPASIQGGVSYQGAWNASTNTPTLTSSVGTKGYYYVVSVAGNTNLNGVTDWLVGDWAIYNGTAWEKIDNTDSVASVNGYTGVVVLNAADVGAPPTTRTISAGTGLTGGGDLSTNRTLSIANTSVTAASYGSASAVPTFTVNGQGQLTAASDVTIAIANTQVSGLGTMSTQNANNVTIAGGSITGITDLAIADGGTGASTAGAALSNLGGIGTITSTDGSIVVTPSGTSVDLAVSAASPASTLLTQVRNTTGTTLAKGTVVYISGATGQIATVSKAIATSDTTSAQTLGMITANLANNSNGYVTVFGLLENMDTSAYTDGAQLYLSGTTAGAVTATKPHAPIHLVYVAVVEYAHPTQGKLLVKVQNGYELDEIHDVSIVSPVTGQTIVYNSATSLWENNTVSLTAGVNGTLPVANGGTGVTTSTGTGSVVLSTSPTLVTPLLGTPTSATLTNATGLPLTTGVTGTLPIANGGTGQTSANAAFNALAPSQTGNSGKYLTTDGTDTSWASNPLGTVTSVAATVPSFLSISGSPITTSGTLAFGLSGTALPTTSGGTGLTSFTSNGVVYASSSSALTTGSALTFDGTFLTASRGITVNNSGIATSGFYNGVNVSGYDALGWTGSSSLVFGGYRSSQWGEIQFYTSGSEQMRLTSTGLGIGTSSPTGKFTAQGSVGSFYVDAGATGVAFTYNGGNYISALGGANAFLVFETGGAVERMRLDSSGNLGLGVTPSAWTTAGGSKALQITSFGAALSTYGGGNTSSSLTHNAYFDGTNWRYTSSSVGSALYQTTGANAGSTHSWSIAAGGTAGDPISFTQAMTLDASANLLVGGTSVYAATITSYASASRSGGLGIRNSAGTAAGGIYTGAAGSGSGSTDVYVEGAGLLGFITNGSERMRLDSSGNLGLGVTPSAWGTGWKAMQVGPNSAAGFIAGVGNDTYFGDSAYYNSGWKYAYSGVSVSLYRQTAGVHSWSTAASGTAGNPISFTQAMTLDASGNLVIGNTSATYKLDVWATTSIVGQIRNNTVGTGTLAQLQFSTNNNYDGFSKAAIGAICENANTRATALGLYSEGSDGTLGERARIDSSGNVGIGTNSPSAKLHVAGSVIIDNADAINELTFSGTQFTNVLSGSSSGFQLGTTAAGYLAFLTNNSERVRITSGGELLVGSTAVISGRAEILQVTGAPGSYGAIATYMNASTTQDHINFVNSNGSVGKIQTSGSTTTYATSSDYRLKEDIQPMTGAMAKVAQLKPVTYKWKVDGSDGEGFIAHELAEVVPQCVTGEKDAVDADGNPVYQGIDTSFLVATLTAAIQELKAEFDAYKASHP